MGSSDRRLELTDDILGAYVDGELDAATRTSIEATLAADADCRRRVAAIRDVTELVRHATHYQGRHTTARSDALVMLRATRRAPAAPSRATRHLTWRNLGIAASLVAAALAVTLGLLLQVPRNAAHGWQQSALQFHSSYLRARAGGNPDILVDVVPGDAQAAGVYAPIIDYEPVLPDLSEHEYAPTGTRLVTSPDGPTVFVIYEAPGRSPVGFSVIRATPAQRSAPATTSLRDVQLVSWSDGEFEYALSSELPFDALSPIVETARRSIGAAAAAPEL